MNSRITLQPAYVLHRRPFQNTSLLVDLFTLDFGLIREFASQEGLPVIDLLDDYDPLSSEEIARLYYHRDLHWNVDGHRRAGLLIADWFKGQLHAKEQKLDH